MFEGALKAPGQSKGEEELALSIVRGSLLLEVWHQTPPAQSSTLASSELGVVQGRKLSPSQPDVLLGVAHVPLVKLLGYSGKNSNLQHK